MGCETHGAHLQQWQPPPQGETGGVRAEPGGGEPHRHRATSAGHIREQSRSQARTAFDNFRTEERSLKLSKDIMDRTSIKFSNGAAASFELTQEQGNYLIAQQTYIQRMPWSY
jgi:hypothetical protein